MEPAHTRASRRTPALVVLVLALCLALAAGGLLAWRQAHPAQALHLEPAGDTGAAPFLDAAHAEPATFSDTVRASVIEASARRSVAPATGTRTAGQRKATISNTMPITGPGNGSRSARASNSPASCSASSQARPCSVAISRHPWTGSPAHPPRCGLHATSAGKGARP